ncbi:hypothetical protein EK21DRAFT_98877 [Setomelanomma holmii]|uniref:FAD/NAD(P)-binding domain-containing protein n=1 Tax=Setomelanomma holmii TaxID=210430 RepID=A0A9P4HFR6_9PLEO|nr:hypothetical protein EK21DRAFT_98877 [Setomelanomma holmii]
MVFANCFEGVNGEISADIIIVGGDFGSCYALHRFRGLGHTVKLLEAGSDFGGMWYFNKYLRAQVESEVPIYQLSLPEAWRNFKFQGEVPGYIELQKYFSTMTKSLDLHKDAIFNPRAFMSFFPGLTTIPGPIIYPASWPSNPDLTNKKVGIIGYATLFPDPEAEEGKNNYGALFTFAKEKSQTGYQYDLCTESFYTTPHTERQRLYEDLWARGGFDKTSNAEVYTFWASKMRARMQDAEKKEIMALVPSLEMDYWECIDRADVELVNLKTNGIARMTKTGVVTRAEEGEEKIHELDVLVVATAYDNVTGFLFDMSILDHNEMTSQEKWKQGICTWLGMLVPEMPSAFLLYGPQAPSGLANGPPFLDMQVDWLAELLNKTKEEGEPIEVKSSAAKAYREKNLAVYKHLLISETQSWWNGANIPGKPNEPLFWVAGLQAWKQQCEEGMRDLSKYLV